MKKPSTPRERDGIHLAEPSPAADPQSEADAAIAAAEQAIFQAMPDIVTALIAKAKGGSYLHANFLFNFAGADNRGPEDDGDDDEQGNGGSMVDSLMKKLDGEAAT